METEAKVWEPTSEQAAHLLSFSQNNEYFIKNSHKMRSQYAGKFIAIVDGDVLLSKSDGRALLDALKKTYSKSFSKIYVTYVPKEGEVRIA